MPTAHLLYGFVGAGKTTFARRLEREYRATRFTHDEWMHTLYGPNPAPTHEQFAVLLSRVDGLIWQCAGRVLQLGGDVIMDHGFWSRKSRDQARSRIADLGARAVLYKITCPEDLMRQRVAKRTQDVPGDSLWIDAAAFECFKSRFEPLGNDEDCVVIDGTAKPGTPLA